MTSRSQLRFALGATLCAAWITAAATTLPAQEFALEFDTAGTKIEFTLADVLHTVHGAFQLKSGAIRFDPDTGKATGKAVVDAASGDSGSRGRDRRMRKDILQSERYPEITFIPSFVEGRVAPEGESHVQVHGVFRLCGQDHDIVLPANVSAGGQRWSATAHFVVPYVKWGLKNPSTLILRVSDKVEIDLRVVGTVSRTVRVPVPGKT